MWVGYMTMEYVNQFHGALKQSKEYSFLIHTFRLTLYNLGGSYTFGTFHMKQCSSQCFSLEILFVVALSFKIADTIHNSFTIHVGICTNVKFFQ